MPWESWGPLSESDTEKDLNQHACSYFAQCDANAFSISIILLRVVKYALFPFELNLNQFRTALGLTLASNSPRWDLMGNCIDLTIASKAAELTARNVNLIDSEKLHFVHSLEGFRG